MNKNEIYEVLIEDISSQGAGVGRVDGIPVFVPEAALGDQLKIKVLKCKKSYAFARIEEIICPSADRIENFCSAFPRCGGCSFRHISYESEKKIKENNVYNAMKRIAVIDLKPQPIMALGSERYRNKAQYPIAEGGLTGFYAAHSHRVIPNADCLLEPEEFSAVQRAFAEWLRYSGSSVYNEEIGRGICRHLYIRKGFASGEIGVTLIINGDFIEKPELFVELLKNALGKTLKSVCLNINKSENNVVLGNKNICLYGREYITDTLCGIKVRISPNSFYQVNHDMAELLYRKAKQYAEPSGKTVLDLYCGAGTIGLSMAKEAKRIIGAEIVEPAVIDARLNARENGIENAEFICGDAYFAAKELESKGIKPDVVIVDPPRKGCDPELLELIAHSFSPERVVYVSCDAATLARDAAILRTNGYELIEYTPADLFPRTSHVETVARFERRSDINS